MKDYSILAPAFVAGGVTLMGVYSDVAHFQRNPNIGLYFLFLGFLFLLVFFWNRGKQQAAERLKAIELGYEPFDPTERWTLVKALVALGAGVPLGIFGIALVGSLYEPGMRDTVWLAAAAVTITVLICGTILLSRLPVSAFTPNPPSHLRNGYHDPKPAQADPDALDVAGRRG